MESHFKTGHHMLIQRVEIENFRSLKRVNLDCGDVASPDSLALVALLGRNGGGKSSVLYALDAFYDVAARISTDDCYGRDPSNEITIRVTYGSLRAQEKQEFQSYIEKDQLIITKRIQLAGGTCIQKYFAAARRVPQFAELRKLGRRDRIKTFKELVAAGTLPGLAGNPRSADDVDALMIQYESEPANAKLLQTVEREEQFFGPKEIGGGKLDKFTKFVLVPAVRDASAEAVKKGVIYELINLIVLRRVNLRPDVRALRDEMKQKIASVFCEENLKELGELGASISRLLEQYAPGAALKLHWGNPVSPEIPLPPALAELIEDEFPCPITHAGHGLQRALILTLLQHLAMTERPAKEADETSESQTDATSEKPGKPDDEVLNPDLILAIEEPELYLHPSRCRYLSELLLKLGAPSKEKNAPRNQIIYATHSPYFVDLDRFDQVRIARKRKEEGQPAPCCVISQYSLHDAAKELARIAAGKQEDFSRESFRARSRPVMTIAVNEGFFANVVVVVEGLGDVGILWKVQEILNQGWSAKGIAVVPAMGKENLDRPVVVFKGLGIPTYFVFDADNRHKGGPAEKSTVDRNARYQRMAGVPPVEFPETQVHDTWAVFADEMGTILKDAAGAGFDRIANAAAAELKYDGPTQLMKNIEGSARLVESIYKAGYRVCHVEEIVRRVTALHEGNR
ncbi:ATP-dependent nuclease [Fontivita pretiosa]|uniref:ATP-dependent nuclease n=1 Tax=Fontivita pretiosa TaxID=2989684 RepID=UPI003D16C029